VLEPLRSLAKERHHNGGAALQTIPIMAHQSCDHRPPKTPSTATRSPAFGCSSSDPAENYPPARCMQCCQEGDTSFSGLVPA
jgi:hypothetical protein